MMNSKQAEYHNYNWILSALCYHLCDVSAKNFGDTLESKYGIEDVGIECLLFQTLITLEWLMTKKVKNQIYEFQEYLR